MSFANLKKSAKNSLDKITEQVQKISNPEGGGREPDKRFWQPTVDKSGNGYAVIRFLPAPEGEDVPFVRMWEHGFKSAAGKWYIEKSLTTLGKPDPVSEYNSQLWATGTKENQDLVRAQKRKLTFISNIYVVSDKANPENEGKVFLFKYGKKIFDKLNAAMHPEFEDETPIDPFNLWTGANFKLKIMTVNKFRNYDKSEFETAGPLFNDDSELESVWQQEHKLQELLDEKHFKSYDDLKTRLYSVLNLDGGGNARPVQSAATRNLDDDEDETYTPAPTRKAAAPAAKAKAEAPWDDDDEDLEAFKSLINDD
jgi:hypothetical protein